MLVDLSACVQGVPPSTEDNIFGPPIILVMVVMGLRMDLDQLNSDATPFVHEGGNIGRPSSFLSLFLHGV